MNRPTSIIHIGITGHRFLTDVEPLTAALEQAAHFLIEKYPDADLEVLSGLAEGADRLAAEIFLENGASLTAVLPLAIEEYQKDFSASSSLNEFQQILSRAKEIISLPPQPNHALAYQVLGEYLLQRSDVLITLWDGQNSTSPGSTGDISTRALSASLPLIWIQAVNHNPSVQNSISAGQGQGKLEFFNF